MIGSRGLGVLLPDHGGQRSGFFGALCSLIVGLADGILDAAALLGFFLRRQAAAKVGVPRLRNAGSPAAECTGGDVVGVQHIPSSIIATLAVGREPLQFAIGNDCFRRLDSGLLHGGAELVDNVGVGDVLCRFPLPDGGGISVWG
ncbi:hypothetical protein [Thiobacter aerophilum]|uniref:Uncharacterized protein n=1 Tax=Thiobacter aerophilum TaxID=3121275 RepID=A0ABV0EGS2_9BURK